MGKMSSVPSELEPKDREIKLNKTKLPFNQKSEVKQKDSLKSMRNTRYKYIIK